MTLLAARLKPRPFEKRRLERGAEAPHYPDRRKRSDTADPSLGLKPSVGMTSVTTTQVRGRDDKQFSTRSTLVNRNVEAQLREGLVRSLIV